MREIHSEYNKKWRITNANLWLSQKYRDCPLIADDIQRAVSATTINPYVMFVVGCVTSQWFSSKKCDYFACGLEGNLEDQIVNASIAWQDLKEIGELKLTEPQLQTYDTVWKNFVRFMDGMVNKDPEPLPTPPPPPKPKPPEVPPTPQPKPDEPKNDSGGGKQKPAWMIKLGVWLGVISGAMWLVKLFLPGVAGQVIDVVIQVLKAIVNM